MVSLNRRRFLADVGQGMLVAGVGAAAAIELGLASPLLAAEGQERLTFGPLEPLVGLMQQTPPDRLLPVLVKELQQGAELKSLVSAAALANARAFGGEDYTGYHTLMALMPAYQMAAELPSERRALPILKVLYRNTSRIHEQEADDHDALHPVARRSLVDAGSAGEQLREAIRAVNRDEAEARFATIAAGPAEVAFDHLQMSIQDEVNVHRVVLAWRSWDLLSLTGPQHAHSLLRQSVRFCLQSEAYLVDHDRPRSPIRELLPQLLDTHHLLDRPVGTRPADDAWIEQLGRTIFKESREQAAGAVAEALAEGFDPEDVGAAISLAANLLVLHDPGRRPEHSTAQKPPGCVHGDSVGVHASDAANAWRHIARVSGPRNQAASLIVAAFHTAGQGDWVTDQPFPYAELLEEISTTDASRLLPQVEEAIRANDQARASALVHHYGLHDLSPRPLFDQLLKYAVSEDGALHAEKYYRTVAEEFATSRPSLRWQQLTALARVTASEYGYAAPGYAEACALLRLT